MNQIPYQIRLNCDLTKICIRSCGHRWVGQHRRPQERRPLPSPRLLDQLGHLRDPRLA